MSDELTRRNTESAFQAIRDMDVMVRETKLMIDAQNQAIASINSRVTALEAVLNNWRITVMGTKPTVKE